MKDQSIQFTKEALEKMLSQLNDELQKNEVTGEICIVGGAAMILAFGSRHSTKDIDALVISPVVVRTLAAEVARIHGFPPTWLNDGAKGFSSGVSPEATPVLSFSHLRILIPTSAYILAMKCLAARVGLDEHDKEDAKHLIKHLGLQGTEAVLRIVEKYYPKERIPAKTQYFVEEVCNELLSETKDNR